jgi:hypothetical protein
MVLRTAARALGLVAAGVALGVASLAAVLWIGQASGTVAVGAWRTNTASGSPDADVYTRARVALVGLFALGRAETLYYVARVDDAGDPLDGRCDYRLEGRDLPARWWSITAYAPDSFLVPNDARVYSRSKSTVHRDADGAFVVRVSATAREGDFLPVPPDGAFDLTARLYNPDDAVQASPGAAALPRIVKERCR